MEMQKQLDIIKNIKDNLGASTGVNFESKVHHVLGRYYTYIGKKFSKHGSAGGDGGNDAVVFTIAMPTVRAVFTTVLPTATAVFATAVPIVHAGYIYREDLCVSIVDGLLQCE